MCCQTQGLEIVKGLSSILTLSELRVTMEMCGLVMRLDSRIGVQWEVEVLTAREEMLPEKGRELAHNMVVTGCLKVALRVIEKEF